MAHIYGDVAMLKARVNIPDDDTSRDVLLASALDAASQGIDRACGRRFWLDETPIQRTFNPRRRLVAEVDGQLLLTDDIGSTEDMVVEVGAGASYQAVTDYETWPENALADEQPVTGLLRVFDIWAVTGMRVRITTRFGWPVVPGPVTEAALIQAQRLYRRKDSPEGVAASSEWGVVRVSRRDPDVWNLIEPYILPGFG
jgi:hypothetical protein